MLLLRQLMAVVALGSAAQHAGVLHATDRAAYGMFQEQQAADSAAILLAVARYLGPTQDTNLVLDSRPSYKESHGNDRAIAEEIGRLLHVRVGHYGDVFGCGNQCRFPDAHGVMALNSPRVEGDHARVNVESIYRGRGRVARGGQEYLLTKVGGKWRVTGLGVTTYDS